MKQLFSDVAVNADKEAWSRRFDRLSAIVTPATFILIGALTIACGSDPAENSSGTGISCSVGETVAQDSKGNKFCKASADGTISGTDAGATDAAGAADAGGGSGTADGSGGGFDGNSSGVDAGPIDPWWSCPPVKRTTGAAHGKPCKVHDDCLYGNCVKGGHLTGYDDSISYCSKNNACTGGGSLQTAPCGSDDGAPAGVTYKSAFEKSKSSGNTKRTSKAPIKVCARTCKSDSECQGWNPEMPDCITASTKYISLGTQGICGKNPLK